MPKYIPKDDDLYNTNPCFICGDDVIDEKADTCSSLCETQKQIFEDDYQWFLSKDYEGEDGDW